MAIEDAAVLARQLLGGGAPAPNLAAFAEGRYPRTSAITRASWRFRRLGQWEGRLPCWLRDRLIGLVLLAVGPPELRDVRRGAAPGRHGGRRKLTG